VATTTCVASYAATHFGLIMPIAEFSKKCDGTSHRGRWQAQGGGIDEGEGWNQSTPLTLSDGLQLLDTLYNRLSPKDRRARADAYELARLFARRIAIAGGVTVEGLKFERNFPPGREVRIDLEVRKGRAFVPD